MNPSPPSPTARRDTEDPSKAHHSAGHYLWVRQILKDWRDAVGATPTISQEYTRITGKQPRSFRTWVEDNADLFR